MTTPRTGGSLGQLNRLLTLVPYLHARGSVRLSEAAELLGVTPQQLVKDLKVLFMCGLPGGYPDDLIDVDLDALETEDGALRSDGVIRISNADYLARPMRLTGREASAVIVALHALRETADEQTVGLVDAVLGKLSAAAGVGPVPIGGATATTGAPDPEAERLRTLLSDAIQRGVQARIDYYTPGRDASTTRVVDPHALNEHDGHTYLDAWCHDAGGARVFRLDRISAADALDSPITTAPPEGESTELFRSGGGEDQRTRVTLRLAAEARWLTEYYPVENVRVVDEGTGETEAEMLVADQRWLTRLLLRVAPHARVVTPSDFGEDLAEVARRALLGYRPSAK